MSWDFVCKQEGFYMDSEFLCKECATKNENAKAQAAAEERESNLLEELADEQAQVGTQPFWQNMKKLFDVKFDNFEKKFEQNINNSELTVLLSENHSTISIGIGITRPFWTHQNLKPISEIGHSRNT